MFGFNIFWIKFRTLCFPFFLKIEDMPKETKTVKIVMDPKKKTQKVGKSEAIPKMNLKTKKQKT